MRYMLIFKGYLGDELKFEEWHYFSDLGDLYNYVAVKLKFVAGKNLYDRYTIRVKNPEVDNMPLAA